MKQERQKYNDGVVSIYSVGNIAEPGNMPKEGLVPKVVSLRYAKRTVGMGRYWAALQAHAKVDMILRVPQLKNVSTQDIAMPIDGHQYKIVQVQYPEDVTPPVMDLSLERLVQEYDIV